MAQANPNPGLITDEIWAFRTACVEGEPGTEDVGIYANKPGFHNTVDANRRSWPGNYSVALPVLLQGPWNKARAFDWKFPEAQRGDFRRINVYSQRLLAASTAHDPRLYGLYEWFGTKDGANIGYNVWKDRPASSDDSHDWHIHFSFLTPNVVTASTFSGILSVLFPGGSNEDMELIKKIQQGLKDAGFDPGPVDGEWGPRTNAAFVAALKATGAQGPAGPQGPQGPQGIPGELVGREIVLTGKVTQVG